MLVETIIFRREDSILPASGIFSPPGWRIQLILGKFELLAGELKSMHQKLLTFYLED